jgi:hypothetical protein
LEDTGREEKGYSRITSVEPLVKWTLSINLPSRPLTGVPRGMIISSLAWRTMMGTGGSNRRLSRIVASSKGSALRTSLGGSAQSLQIMRVGETHKLGRSSLTDNTSLRSRSCISGCRDSRYSVHVSDVADVSFPASICYGERGTRGRHCPLTHKRHNLRHSLHIRHPLVWLQV